MSKIAHIDVEIRPSIGFQTVGLTARVAFDTPVDSDEALAEANLVATQLKTEANEILNGLIEVREQSEARTTASVSPTAAPRPAATPSDGWAIGVKPKGAGTFKYLTSAAFSTERLKADVAGELAGLGISPDDVDIYDDRVGKYGLETGNEAYQPAKVKVKDGTQLSAALQGKNIVAGVDFNADGTVKVALTKDGRAALQAIMIASNLSGTPF